MAETGGWGKPHATFACAPGRSADSPHQFQPFRRREICNFPAVPVFLVRRRTHAPRPTTDCPSPHPFMKTSPTVVRSARALLLALVAIATVSLGLAAPEPEARRTLEGTLPATLRTVHIDHRLGPVTVTGVDQDFGWRWVLDCSGDKSRAETFVQASQLEVLETGGTLEIRFAPADRDAGTSSSRWRIFGFSWSGLNGLKVESRLELRLPRAVTLQLENRFGPVRATGLRGALTLDCQNSSVDLSDLPGAVTATTTFGRLQVERTGAAHLRTQNGDLRARHIGGDLRAETSFAKMQIEDVKGRADLKNQNGEIDASDIAGDVTARSSFAGIQVRDVKGRVHLRNQNGRIDARRTGGGLSAESSFASLHAEDIGGDATLKSQNGKISALRIAGPVTASTTFGSVRVEDVRSDATLDAQNGDVTAHDVTGVVRASGTFGRMELDGDGKRFEARNQNGSVQIKARSSTVEQIHATTSFGAIDVSLPRDCQPLIQANTSFGKVKSAFPLVGADSSAPATRGASQPKLTLRGQNGDVRVQGLAPERS